MSLRLCFVGIVLFTALCAAGCSNSASVEADAATGQAATARISVELARVERADLAAPIELVGSLLPRRRTVIVAEVDGVIKDVANIEKIPEALRSYFDALVADGLIDEMPSLDLGTRVSKGEEIVWLDPSEYRLKLAAAQARLDSAKRELEKLHAWRRPEEIQQSKAGRDEAAASAAAAESDFDRAKQLIARAAISESQYDQTEAAVKMARAVLDRTEAELAMAKAGPTKEEIAVAEAAVAQAEAEVALNRWEVDKTTIRAPYDGIITDRYVDEGERVTAMPRVEIMEIMDLSFLTARLGVPERHIGRIQVGDLAKVHVQGSAEPVPGVVALINDKVDRTNRTFRIRVAIRNDERRFKVGQFIRVQLQVQSSPGALTIPADAIAYTGGEAHVFVCDGGRVGKRAVKLGIANENTVEVLAGLADGEQIVVDDPSILSDSMSVEVRTTNEGPQRPEKAP